MNALSQTLSKTERLCSRKIITNLFENGSAVYSPFFKIIWQKIPLDKKLPAQVMFSVSKRSFKLAVKRNLIKRRMREAYRKQKFILYDFLSEADVQLGLIIIFKGPEIPHYTEFETAMKETLENLIASLRGKTKNC
jgi:ribonuclease P protein component